MADEILSTAPGGADAGGFPDEVEVLGGTASARALLDSEQVRLLAWRCLADGPAMSSERAHPVPTVAFNFSGVSVVSCRGRASVLDPTQVIVHPAGAPYSAHHPWGCRCRGGSILLAPALIEAVLGAQQPFDRTRLFTVAPPLLARARLLFERVAAREIDEPLEAEEESVALIAALPDPAAEDRLRHQARESTSRLHRRQVENACGYLGEALGERRTLTEVARAANASPAHLGRIFRAATGLSLASYRQRLRLLAALDALCDGADDLSSLAQELGFASHSHLTANFRRDFGCPPSELRRQLGGGVPERVRRTAA
jgi:AraC family transcriptional regulator